MKKTFLLAAILCLFIGSSAFAQIPFKVGIRGGLDIANLSFDPDLPSGWNKSSRLGYKFGAMAELGFIPMIALQIEAMYAQKGAEVETNVAVGNTTTNVKSTSTANVLEVPILLKFRLPVPGSITPYIFAGPNIAFILSSKLKAEGNGQSIETDTKDETSSTNFAVDFGAGIEFKVAPFTSLLLDGRYSLGFNRPCQRNSG